MVASAVSWCSPVAILSQMRYGRSSLLASSFLSCSDQRFQVCYRVALRIPASLDLSSLFPPVDRGDGQIFAGHVVDDEGGLPCGQVEGGEVSALFFPVFHAGHVCGVNVGWGWAGDAESEA